MEKSDILRTLQGLAPNSHVVLFYSNLDAKHELVFPFLQEAIQKQGVAIYAAEHESSDDLREAMRHWGIYVDRHEREHSLIITDHLEFMEAEDRLNGLRSSRLLNELMERLMKLAGPIRVVVDPTILARHGTVDELLDRERSLGRHLDLPLNMICCYEETLANVRGGEFLIEILQAHSHAIFPGIVLQLT